MMPIPESITEITSLSNFGSGLFITFTSLYCSNSLSSLILVSDEFLLSELSMS